MDLWDRPFEAASRTIPGWRSGVALGSLVWDRENAGQLLRILTVNMNGRPVDVAQSSIIMKPFNTDDGLMHQQCDDEYALGNLQERRMRGFFEWLDRLEPHVRPHAIAFQEVMFSAMIDIAEAELAKRGYKTLDKIAFDRGCRTCFPPIVGSGLGIYVHTDSEMEIVDGDFQIFKTRLGADWLCSKGMKWALVRTRNKLLLRDKKVGERGEGYFVILTCHPQAYNQLNSEPPPGESFAVRFLRRLARLDFQLRGGFPWAVAKAHKSQYEQTAEYIQSILLPRVRERIGDRELRGMFLAADLNVNRYAVEPDSTAEQSETRATTSALSREFVALLNTLNSRPPPIIQEPIARLSSPTVAQFSWNTKENSAAAALNPEKPNAFALIDSVIASGLGGTRFPSYIDNRVLAMRLPTPVPEVSPFWSSRCYRWRQRHSRSAYRAVNSAVWRRMRLGRLQYNHLMQLWKRDPRADWKAFVLSAPYRLSSQLWKGTKFYGLQPTDTFVLRETAHLKIGQPHPFRMLTDVTDHHAVLARIIL